MTIVSGSLIFGFQNSNSVGFSKCLIIDGVVHAMKRDDS